MTQDQGDTLIQLTQAAMQYSQTAVYAAQTQAADLMIVRDALFGLLVLAIVYFFCSLALNSRRSGA